MVVKSLLLAGTLLIASQASATVFVVDSAANSSTGGTGLVTFAVAAGQTIRVASSTNDLWTLGALPRFSDANGLVGNRLATALDDSGQSVGTLIGQSFGLYTQAGYTAPYGALVGEIGGVYKLLGANGLHTAWGTGTLKLYNWDSNRNDNAGSISVKVAVVPEPATWAMLIAGFGLVGASLRQRRTAAQSA